MATNTFTIFFLCALTFCGLSLEAHAQELFPTTDTFTIQVSPEYPEAGETVTLRAAGNDLVLQNSAMSWQIDGDTIASGVGKREVAITLGKNGQSTFVEAVAIAPNGSRAYASTTLRPSEIDIVWSANSYTPPFFRGRALPSAGATMRLEAIPRIVRGSGTAIPSNELMYTWERDGRVIGAVSGRGKNIVEVPAPPLFGTNVLTVTAKSADGAYTGSASVRIASTEPLLMLYQDHPLFGMLSHTALKSNSVVRDSETTLTAVPYYADIAHSKTDYLFDWFVNNAPVTESRSENRLIVRTEGNAGPVRIELRFAHAINWLQSAQAMWNIIFDPSAQSDVFGRE